MKIFIAGATGAIGHPLISRLVAAGHDVVGMTSSERSLQTLREAGAEGVVANALDAQAVQLAMNKARPDAVIEELTSLPRKSCLSTGFANEESLLSAALSVFSRLIRINRAQAL